MVPDVCAWEISTVYITRSFQTTQMKKKKKSNSFIHIYPTNIIEGRRSQKACINLIPLNALHWDSENCQLNGQESVKKVRH